VETWSEAEVAATGADEGRDPDALEAARPGAKARRHVLAMAGQLREETGGRIDAVRYGTPRKCRRGAAVASRPAVVAARAGKGLDTAVSFAEGLTRSRPRPLLLAE